MDFFHFFFTTYKSSITVEDVYNLCQLSVYCHKRYKRQNILQKHFVVDAHLDLFVYFVSHGSDCDCYRELNHRRHFSIQGGAHFQIVRPGGEVMQPWCQPGAPALPARTGSVLR